MRSVYCQVVRRESDYSIRFLLTDFNEGSTLEEIKAKWPDTEPAIRRALYVAKADPSEAMALPNPVPDSLGLQLGVKASTFDDPDIDIWRVLIPHIRLTIATAIAERDAEHRSKGVIWTPS